MELDLLATGVVSDLASGITTSSLKNAIGNFFTKTDLLKPELTEEVVDLKTRVNNFEKLVQTGKVNYGVQTFEENQIALSLVDILRRNVENQNEVDYLNSNTPLNGVINILFVTANPDDTTKLRLTKELKLIEQELQKAKYRDVFTFHKKELATIDDLSDGLLNYNPDFVHFTGHGTEKGIILHTENDNTLIINNKSLAQLFKLFSEKLACVFLNSCYSEEQAKVINKYIPNVIGMNDKVPEKPAIAFAKSFYKSIGAGRGLDFSFEFAKISLGLNNMLGDEIPIFHSDLNKYAS